MQNGLRRSVIAIKKNTRLLIIRKDDRSICGREIYRQTEGKAIIVTEVESEPDVGSAVL